MSLGIIPKFGNTLASCFGAEHITPIADMEMSLHVEWNWR